MRHQDEGRQRRRAGAGRGAGAGQAAGNLRFRPLGTSAGLEKRIPVEVGVSNHILAGITTTSCTHVHFQDHCHHIFVCCMFELVSGHY